MKLFTVLVFIVLAALIGGLFVVKEYRYEQNYGNHWSLADKSSTIPAKKKHIEDFVKALEEGNSHGQFAGNNALFLKTPNNSFRENMNALYTLQGRLAEIETMSPSSFEYNTAIQQITAQEQGEAHAMLGVIEGCYALACFPTTWDWVFCISVLVYMLAVMVAFQILSDM